MSIELSDGVHWLNHTHETTTDSEHVAAYLLETDDTYVLVDSGAHHHEDGIRDDLRSIMGGPNLDAIVLSHPDLPHSGNIRAVQDLGDDVELICANSSPELVGLPERTRCEPGGTMAVQGRTMSFIDPPLADIIFTTWPYDHETGTLFTADGFGVFHTPDERDHVYREDLEGLTVERLREFHVHTLRWLPMIEPELLMDHVRGIFDQYDVSFLAPAHGNPIAGELIPEYLDRFEAAVGHIAEGGTAASDD